MKKEGLRLGNIQFFAENEGGEDPKTYSQEEVDKLNAEMAKYKARVDELSKNEKKYKDEIKAKMSEDEKKAQEQEEINKKLADYESRLEDFALKEELVKTNVFTSEEIESIVKEKGDNVALLKTIGGLVNAKIEKAKKDAVAEYMRSSDVSGSGGGAKNGDKDVEAYIEKTKQSSTSKAREYYLNKKR